MTRSLETRNPRGGRSIRLPYVVATVAAAITLAAAETAPAQQALGVPFVGKNHLSVSVTERSRDGVGTERTAVFGGVYGRRLNGDATVQITVIARAAARALDATGGILDAGLTVAATHAVRAIDGLSVTGAAGIAALVWGKTGPNSEEQDRGRILKSVPLTVGMAYAVRVGQATFAPFVATTGAYARGRDYVNGEPINRTSSWRLGHSAGVSVRFRETVLSLSSVSREPGMPIRNRVAFSAGMSW
jgi:hypothetical protein